MACMRRRYPHRLPHSARNMIFIVPHDAECFMLGVPIKARMRWCKINDWNQIASPGNAVKQDG